MRRLPWAALGLVAAGAMLGVVFVGCGSDSQPGDSGDTDSGSETSTADGDTLTDGAASADGFINAITDGGRADASDCKLTAQTCTKSTDCCSANCNTKTAQCEPPLNGCEPPGQACTAGNQCCTFSCIGGTCSNKLCVADNQACGSDNECCGGKCAPDGLGGGKCAPLNGSGPATSGNPCVANADCASKYCNGGICVNPSFCTQTGDVCSTNFECCSGACTKAAGATLGTCGQPASAPGVPGCLPTGVICGPIPDGGTVAVDAGVPPCGGACCSRSCAPYGAAGVPVCQPPSGCHPTGELCRADSDCCGWSGSPDPKKGFVHCSKASVTQEFGRCDNGGACREPGSICKPADYSCNAENNCCDPVGQPSNYCNNNPENCCRRDSLGIPRCLVKPVDCAGAPPAAGTTCATNADCCGAPCVNNQCGAVGSCVPSAGACTSSADCCPGLPCAIPPGGSKGFCGGSVLPDGGVSADGGGGPITTDGGTAGDGGICALYGQQCAQASDCCAGVPCINGSCHYP